MNVLTVSDLHGKAVWQEANADAYDLVVFLGDYTDGYVFDDETIYANLNAIIQQKQQQPDKFVLLIGNHDAQYLHFPRYRCSGFRERAQPELSALFNKHKALFQVAHQQANCLFTHAGVTNRWLTHFLKKMDYNVGQLTAETNLAGLLNDAHRQAENTRDVLFEAGSARGGRNAFGGPVWADRSETKADYLTGFQQIVGHTPVGDFITVGNKTGSITYTDVLKTRTAFYEVVIPD